MWRRVRCRRMKTSSELIIACADLDKRYTQQLFWSDILGRSKKHRQPVQPVKRSIQVQLKTTRYLAVRWYRHSHQRPHPKALTRARSPLTYTAPTPDPLAHLDNSHSTPRTANAPPSTPFCSSCHSFSRSKALNTSSAPSSTTQHGRDRVTRPHVRPSS